jgi:hypothetical protein
MRINPRSAWGALPPERLTRWNVRDLDGVVVHWFGIPKAVKKAADVPAQLRGVQRSHQAGEFSDIAYNFAVDPFGGIWELRGWDVQTGANGTADANRRFLAVVYAAGEGDPLTEAGAKSLGWIIRQAQLRGVGTEVRKHGSITGSACPGPAVGAWIDRKGWSLEPTPLPLHDGPWNLKVKDGLRWKVVGFGFFKHGSKINTPFLEQIRDAARKHGRVLIEERPSS